MSFSPVGNVFDNYSPLSDTYDGLWDNSGQVREHWLSLFDSLQNLGKEELKYKHSEIQRLLRENGVTYNVYGDPAGLYRSWKLDAIPFIIEKEEWKKIEAGLIQRASLLNLILTDIYTDRKLLKEGNLPADLIYNHNGFLRPCDGIKLPGKNQLFMYAVDIARASDGSLWVLNDRTQAPSGSGYALENRSVMSKVMPEIFHGYEIRKLNDFFNTLHNSLVSIAPKGIYNPRIVLLTPGPGNETYFEHAYLSAYLGYNLVHAEYLTVRDGYVWLKTIQGLERVDIILRRVDDSFCDPLELRLDSRLGIPGLVETVRKGNVVVANPMGSSILENSGIMAFLPGLCQHCFNEELLLPSLNTWWCGQANELTYVLENLNKLSIKMIHRRDASRTISHGNLDIVELENLKKLIIAKPYLYVAHEQLQISTIPSLIDGSPDRRFAVLRCFLVAKEGSYVLMPGGLTRSSADRDIFKVSNQYGGISKDTWVLGNESEQKQEMTYLPSLPFTDENFVLPSRTAENMFWAGRYATRSKMIARFLRELLMNLHGSQSQGTKAETETTTVLLRAVTHLTMMYPGFVGEGAKEKLKNPEGELLSIILNQHNSGSLSSTIRFFKRTIFSIRNRWPSDTWRVIDDMDESWKKIEQPVTKNIHLIRSTLDNVINSFVAFMGLNLESIPRDHAYVLLNTGRRIEKSLLLISQLRSMLVISQSEQVEYSLMETILSANMSLTIYRARFRSYLQISACLDLLLFDLSNPASLLYQLESLKQYLSQMPGRQGNGRLSNQQKIIIEAYSFLQNKDSSVLKFVDPATGIRKELEQFLSHLSQLIAQISDAMIAEFFTHSELSQLTFSPMDEDEL